MYKMGGWIIALSLVVMCGGLVESLNDVEKTSPPTIPWNPTWGTQPKNITDFTTFLWYGFSSNKINFTQSDFQELVECTTGKKECPGLDTVPAVSQLTNCTVNKALTPTQCNLISTCGQSEVLETYGKTETIGVDELRDLLPMVVYQSHRDQGCIKTHSNTPKHTKPTPSEVWGYGIIFVTVISGCSLAGVSVLPLMAHHMYQRILTLLVGLAVGSLAASSLFHLIPQAFKLTEQSTDDQHSYLFISLTVLLGIWGFFMIERVIKIIVMHQASKENKKKFPGSSSAQTMLCETNSIQNPEIAENGQNMNVVKGLKKAGSVCDQDDFDQPQLLSIKSHINSCSQNDVSQIYQSQQQVIKASFGHSERPEINNGHNHQIEFQQGRDSVIKTVAWMIIFGDGFHNFIDGVSIGAAFSESILTGISISLAVMCEELPHELGDFAVLLNAGMTMKQAVAYNFLSATTCYLGLFLGIALGEFTQNTTSIFALAAGMFLYIALVDMVPEMNEVASQAAESGWKPALKILMLQNIGIFIGIGSLFCLAYFQDIMVLT